MSIITRIVAIPAGKCPIKLNSTEFEEVVEWCEKVTNHGNENNLNYLPSALRFFAQQFFSIFSDDYKIVCNHINNAYHVDKKNEQDKMNEMIEKTIDEKRILDKEKRDRLDGKITPVIEENKKKRGRPKKIFSSPIIQTQTKTEPTEKIKLVAKRK